MMASSRANQPLSARMARRARTQRHRNSAQQAGWVRCGGAMNMAAFEASWPRAANRCCRRPQRYRRAAAELHPPRRSSGRRRHATRRGRPPAHGALASRPIASAALTDRRSRNRGEPAATMVRQRMGGRAARRVGKSRPPRWGRVELATGPNSGARFCFAAAAAAWTQFTATLAALPGPRAQPLGRPGRSPDHGNLRLRQHPAAAAQVPRAKPQRVRCVGAVRAAPLQAAGGAGEHEDRGRRADHRVPGGQRPLLRDAPLRHRQRGLCARHARQGAVRVDQLGRQAGRPRHDRPPGRPKAWAPTTSPSTSRTAMPTACSA